MSNQTGGISSWTMIILSTFPEVKKKISRVITENLFLKNIEDSLQNEDRILAHRLCGAGNGGYFLVFMDRDKQNENFLTSIYSNVIPIQIVDTGVEGHTVWIFQIL